MRSEGLVCVCACGQRVLLQRRNRGLIGISSVVLWFPCVTSHPCFRVCIRTLLGFMV